MQVNAAGAMAGDTNRRDQKEVVLSEITELLGALAATHTPHQEHLAYRAERIAEHESLTRDARARQEDVVRAQESRVRAAQQAGAGERAGERAALRQQLGEDLRQQRAAFREVLARAKSGSGDVTRDVAGSAAKTHETAGVPGRREHAVEVKHVASDELLRSAAANARAVGGTTEATPTRVGGGQGQSASPATMASSTRMEAVHALPSSNRAGTAQRDGGTANAVNRASSVQAVSKVTGAAGSKHSSLTAGVAAGAERHGGIRSARGGSAGRSAQEATGKGDANVERVLRLMHSRLGRDRSVATLRMDPPELGMIRMRMDLRHNELTLWIDTETDAARRLLGEQLDALRRGLESAGIQLQRVELRVTESSQFSPDAGTPEQSDAGAQEQGGAARGEDGASERGTPILEGDDADADLMESQVGEPSEAPAAESLVNVLA